MYITCCSVYGEHPSYGVKCAFGCLPSPLISCFDLLLLYCRTLINHKMRKQQFFFQQKRRNIRDINEVSWLCISVTKVSIEYLLQFFCHAPRPYLIGRIFWLWILSYTFRLVTATLLCCTDFNSKTSLTGFSDYNVDTQGIFPESSAMY